MTADDDGACHRYEWLRETLDRTLSQLQRTLAETGSLSSEVWKSDWLGRRARVAERLERLESQLRHLLPPDGHLPFRLVVGRDHEIPARSIGAA